MARNKELECLGQLGDHAPLVGNQEPTTPNQQYIASLWCEIIGLHQVSLSDRFLDLGGNSLTLNIILNRIETDMCVSLQAQLFFDPERSSLFELAKELDILIADKPAPKTAPSER